ncbi:ABC transporter permease [Rhizobium esperanzae]|uniref:ABC transporter permease n=1 Tax=Rhizobium esperanzae TaxID=1967781 RepID=UPI001595378A|nr:ABC transporter permease [Rhizobium esperanzae]
MSKTANDPHERKYRAVGFCLAFLVYVFLLAPIVVTIPMAFGSANALTFPPDSYSFDLFKIFFSSPGWIDPLLESLRVALAATAIAMFAGIPAGYWIARHEFVGRRVIVGVLMSPLVIPAIVTALGLYLYLAYLKVSGTTSAIVVGHVTLTLPFVMVMVMAGVQKLDRNLEFGAQLMGAGQIRMFLTVVLPQLVPSLVSAAVFSFLLSFDEVVISWFLAGPNTITLPVRMYSALEWELSPVIAAVSTLLTVVSLFVCLIAVALKKSTPFDG